MKKLLSGFAVIFVLALVYLLSSGFATQLTGNVVGAGNIEKEYAETFSGDVSESLIFDLGMPVTVDEIEVSWTDNRNTCWGQIKVSIDGEEWFLKQAWKDIPSPGVVEMKGIGEIQYIMFEESSCPVYTVSSMKVAGTYIEPLN